MELDADGIHRVACHTHAFLHQLPSQSAAMLTCEHASHMHGSATRLAVQPQIRLHHSPPVLAEHVHGIVVYVVHIGIADLLLHREHVAPRLQYLIHLRGSQLLKSLCLHHDCKYTIFVHSLLL